jgi:hypothetical protein
MPTLTPASTGDDERRTALRDLRARRRRNRLGQIEWFEALYRVYIAALFGGGAVLFVSGLIPDEPLDTAGVSDVQQHGPQVLGVVIALAVAWGLRSGANGGPLAIERADAHHLLLAPVRRRTALFTPAVQRIRSFAFVGGITGAVVGQLAGRRLPGSLAAWAWWGAVFGVIAGLLHVGTALLSHATRLPRPAVTLIGLLLLSWQVAAVASGGDVPGPADAAGNLALWPLQQTPSDLVVVVATAGLAAIGLALVGRTSLEAMVRRSGLVAQLRFAVTMQDLRTVVLLRRQLSQEQTRSRPWIRVPRVGPRSPAWRRSWHSLVRFPASRLLRMLVVATVATICLVAATRGVTPALVGAGLALFVLGLEATEPLAQALDQADLTTSFPVHRGRLLLDHLTAPAAALVPFALWGAGIAALAEPTPAGVAVAAILAVPLALAGAAGAVVNVVKGAPDPLGQVDRSLFMPPEVSGMGTVIRNVWPPALSVLATVPVLFVRTAADTGAHVVGAAARAAVLIMMVVVLVAWWVYYRDDLRRRWRNTMAVADAARSPGGSGTTRPPTAEQPT